MQEIENLLHQYNYETKILSKNRIAVLTDSSRMEVIEHILSFCSNSVYDNTPCSLSSLGKIIYLDKEIVVKPKSKQGMKSSGLENEITIISKLNEECQKHDEINVTFVDNCSKEYKCFGLISCKEMGRDTSNRKKADMILQGKEHNYPISLKKDNAEVYESADGYASEKAKYLIEKLAKEKKIKLECSNNVYKIQPTFAWKATEQEKINVVFGSDLCNNGAVIQKTFGTKPLEKINKNNFICKVSYIFTDITEIKDSHDVWFYVRNDSSRNSKALGFRGLRVLAVYQSRINKNVYRI